MIISSYLFSLLVYSALTVSLMSSVIMILLLVKDIKRGQLW